MKLFVGLGNPGNEYENTRHNIGFMVIDNYANKLKISFKEKFNGQIAELINSNEKTILLKPFSYMNLSGTVVKKVVDYYKINIEDIYIIHDDLDMPIGKIKLKNGGSAGGHNGIKNISENLKNQNYKHIKVGIGKKENLDIKDYVLSKFDKQEKIIIDNSISTVVKILINLEKMPFDKAMSLYNGENNVKS